MKHLFEFFVADRSGATAIEYALIAGALSIAMATAVFSIGSSLNSTFTSVSSGFK